MALSQIVLWGSTQARRFTVSLILADLNADKIPASFPQCVGGKNVKSLSRIWGQNNGH